jgi:hypothetical protein
VSAGTATALPLQAAHIDKASGSIARTHVRRSNRIEIFIVIPRKKPENRPCASECAAARRRAARVVTSSENL